MTPKSTALVVWVVALPELTATPVPWAMFNVSIEPVVARPETALTLMRLGPPKPGELAVTGSPPTRGGAISAGQTDNPPAAPAGAVGTGLGVPCGSLHG